jgi:hypothetical protein
MGSLFLAWLMADIQLPPSPKPLEPPIKTQQESRQDLYRLQQHRRKQEQETKQNPPPPAPSNAAISTAPPEPLPPPPAWGPTEEPHLQTTFALNYPHLKTSKTQHADRISPSLSCMWWQSPAPTKKTRWGGGLRLQSVEGWGVSEEIFGRFNWLYVGPSGGFTRLWSYDRSEKKEAATAADNSQRYRTVIDFYGSLYGGVAIVSVASQVPAKTGERPKEYQPGVQLGDFGVWVEAAAGVRFDRRWGLQLQSGWQQGSEKSVLWFGFGSHLWL